MSILVIDVGTSGVRAAMLHPDGELGELHHRATPPSTPSPGLVEFDATGIADTALELATRAGAAGGVEAVAICNQRASTVVWDAATGEPVGPGLGWQDLRTVGECMAATEHGLRLAPNQSATKVAWLLAQHDPDRRRDLRFGTIDSWLVWRLTNGEVHATDHTNAAVTGLCRADASAWDQRALDVLGIPAAMMPTIVDSSGPVGVANALPGSPIIMGMAGDQQASLIGQSCVRPHDTKITFGTGGMLDVCTGSEAPSSGRRLANGTFPIVTFSRGGACSWGLEAIMLSAGTNVEWLRDDLGIIDSAAASHDVAAACNDADGVLYVPALLGLGTPHWDYGARGTLVGLTRGTTRSHVVRAVLEGVAHRGTDLVEAAEADAGLDIPVLRIDGGMSANPTFVQALANASGRPVEVSRHLEATTVGAGYLAGLAAGTWTSLDDIAAMWAPGARVEPGARLDRDRWARATQRSAGWIPELSALDF